MVESRPEGRQSPRQPLPRALCKPLPHRLRQAASAQTVARSKSLLEGLLLAGGYNDIGAPNANRCDADETAPTIPARDLREGLKHHSVTSTSARPLRCRAPPSDHSRLPRPKGSCSRRLLEGGRRPAAPAARSRPADPSGSGGRRCIAGHAARSRQCAVADGVVAPSGHPIRAVDVPKQPSPYPSRT